MPARALRAATALTVLIAGLVAPGVSVADDARSGTDAEPGSTRAACDELGGPAPPVASLALVERLEWCSPPPRSPAISPLSETSPSDATAPAARAPEDCTIPTVDDRCELWTSRFDHPDRGNYGADQVTDVVSAEGAVYVVGGTWVGATGGFDVMVHRLDDDGELIWSRIVDLGGFIDGAHEAAVTVDGSRLYLTGETRSTMDDPADLFVMAIETAGGEPLWHVVLDREKGDDYGTWIGIGPEDETVYAVASSTGSTGVDVWTVALDAESGAIAWTERFDGPESGNDHPAGVALSSDGGRLHVAGAAYGAMGADLFAVSYELGPTRREGPSWVTVQDLTGIGGADQATTLSVAPDGGLVAAGYVQAGPPDPVGGRTIDMVAVGLDPATGSLRWRTDIAAPPAAGHRLAVATASRVSPDGGTVVLAGGSALGSALTDFGMHAAALDTEDGTLRWSVHHQPPGSQYGYASDVDFSEDGSQAYVVGNSWFGVFASKGDLTSLALETEDGDQLWVARLLYRDGDPRDFFPYPAYAAVIPGSGRVVAATTYVGNVFSEDEDNYADVLAAAYDGS